MKFINLSPSGTDFNSELQSQLRIINGNVLYLTREIDHIKLVLMEINSNRKLQKQVDEYFEESTKDIPEEEQ